MLGDFWLAGDYMALNMPQKKLYPLEYLKNLYSDIDEFQNTISDSPRYGKGPSLVLVAHASNWSSPLIQVGMLDPQPYP